MVSIVTVVGTLTSIHSMKGWRRDKYTNKLCGLRVARMDNRVKTATWKLGCRDLEEMRGIVPR